MDRSIFKTVRHMLPLPLRAAVLRGRRHLQDYISGESFCRNVDPAGPDFTYRVFSHAAHLVREYPEPWYSLQQNKIRNLKKAVPNVDGIVIAPGETFSFWHLVGKPSKNEGYTEGMTVSEGGLCLSMGGGLCQLSNALYWTALNLGFEIVERHRHSLDIFPDSNRDAPFAAGATVAYNYVDLRFRNPHAYSVRLSVTLDDEWLRIMADSDFPPPATYLILEMKHRYVTERDVLYRENELWRISLVDNVEEGRERVAANRGRVLYEVQE